MKGFQTLFNENPAIVQSVGYPDPNFSHLDRLIFDFCIRCKQSRRYRMAGGLFVSSVSGISIELSKLKEPDPLAIQIGSNSTAFIPGVKSFKCQ